MTRDEILTDLRRQLETAVAEQSANVQVDNVRHIEFLRGRIRFYESEWPEIYEQWNVSKPPAEAVALIEQQKERMGISTIEIAQEHVGNCLLGLWNVNHITFYERRLQEEITKEVLTAPSGGANKQTEKE